MRCHVVTLIRRRLGPCKVVHLSMVRVDTWRFKANMGLDEACFRLRPLVLHCYLFWVAFVVQQLLHIRVQQSIGLRPRHLHPEPCDTREVIVFIACRSNQADSSDATFMIDGSAKAYVLYELCVIDRSNQAPKRSTQEAASKSLPDAIVKRRS